MRESSGRPRERKYRRRANQQPHCMPKFKFREENSYVHCLMSRPNRLCSMFLFYSYLSLGSIDYTAVPKVARLAKTKLEKGSPKYSLAVARARSGRENSWTSWAARRAPHMSRERSALRALHRQSDAEEISEEAGADTSPHVSTPPPFADLAALQHRLLSQHQTEEVDAGNELSNTQSSQLSAQLTELASSLRESSLGDTSGSGGLRDMLLAFQQQQNGDRTEDPAPAMSAEVAALRDEGFTPLAAALAAGRIHFPLQTDTGAEEEDDESGSPTPFERPAAPRRAVTAPAGALGHMSFMGTTSPRPIPSALEVPSVSRSRSGSSDDSGCNSPDDSDTRRTGLRAGRSASRSVAPSRRGIPQPCPGVSKWRKPASPDEGGVMTELGIELQRPGGNWRNRSCSGSSGSSGAILQRHPNWVDE